MQDRQDTFKWGYFVAQHKAQIKKIAFFLFIAAVVLIWLVFFLKLGSYFLGRSSARLSEQSLTEQIVNFQAIKPPQLIQIVEKKVLNRAEGRVDVFVHLKNPNEKWTATAYTYSLTVGGTTTTQTSFLLPNEDKFLVISDIATSSQDIEFTSQKTKWRKVKNLKQLQKMQFATRELSYSPVFYEGTGGNIFSQVKATVLNESVYGFRQTQVVVLLVYNEEIIGVATTEVLDWRSGEEKSFSFGWPKKFPLAVQLKLVTSTDILTEENLILPGE